MNNIFAILRSESHKIIGDNVRNMNSEAFDVPSKRNIVYDVLFIFFCAIGQYNLTSLMRQTYRASEKTALIILCLIGIIICQGVVLVAFIHIIVVVYLRIENDPGKRYNFLYGIVRDHYHMIIFVCSGFLLSPLIKLYKIPFQLANEYKDDMNITKISLKERIYIFILENCTNVITGGAFLLFVFLIGDVILFALNYRMYMSHYEERIKKNKADMDVIRLFQYTLGYMPTDAKQYAQDLIESLSSDGIKITHDDLIRAYGDISGDRIIKLICVTDGDEIGVESIELFCCSTLNEVGQLADALMEKDITLSTLKTIFLVVEVSVGLLAFLACIGQAEQLRRNSFVVGSSILGAGYVFSSIIVEFFKTLFFVLFLRPFDVGDIIIVDGIKMFVKDIGIVRTTVKIDSLSCDIPNMELIGSKIINLRKSSGKEEVFNLSFNLSDFLLMKDKLIRRLDEVTGRRPEVYKAGCRIEDVVIKGNDCVNVTIRAFFRINFQEISNLQQNKDRFALEIAKIVNDIGLIVI